jgi:hypothetical protein
MARCVMDHIIRYFPQVNVKKGDAIIFCEAW